MSSSGRLTALALVLATASLLATAYAVLSRPPAPEAAACDCDTEGLRAQLAALQRRLDAAERTAVRGTVRRVADAALEPADERAPTDDDAPYGADDEAEPADDHRTTPRFVELTISEPGVTIIQSESGALSVSNTNPALAGQVLTVEARDEHGQLHDLPITVPPVP